MSVIMMGESANRAAVMTWRDEAALTAVALLNASAVSAMRMLETRLGTIAMPDAMLDGGATARAIVRPAMRRTIGEAADCWFNAHARALRQVDARLEPLALRFAAMTGRPALPMVEATPAVIWRAPGWLRGPVDKLGSAIERATGEVAERALPDAIRTGVSRLSSRIGHEIGARSGAHERLREGGRSELARAWLGVSGGDGASRSYLAQLLDVVDRTAVQAKEIVG